MSFLHTVSGLLEARSRAAGSDLAPRQETRTAQPSLANGLSRASRQAARNRPAVRALDRLTVAQHKPVDVRPLHDPAPDRCFEAQRDEHDVRVAAPAIDVRSHVRANDAEELLRRANFKVISKALKAAG